MSGITGLVSKLDSPQRAHERARLQAELQAAVIGSRQTAAYMKKLHPSALSSGLLAATEHNQQLPRSAVLAMHRTWLVWPPQLCFSPCSGGCMHALLRKIA